MTTNFFFIGNAQIGSALKYPIQQNMLLFIAIFQTQGLKIVFHKHWYDKKNKNKNKTRKHTSKPDKEEQGNQGISFVY